MVLHLIIALASVDWVLILITKHPVLALLLQEDFIKRRGECTFTKVLATYLFAYFFVETNESSVQNFHLNRFSEPVKYSDRQTKKKFNELFLRASFQYFKSLVFDYYCQLHIFSIENQNFVLQLTRTITLS